MRNDYRNRSGEPPVWAEALLRALVVQRSRDAIAGDLLEEYRESVLPSIGTFRAQLWYLRQVLSFLHLPGPREVVGRIPARLLWGTAAVGSCFLVFVVSYGIGIALSTALLLLTGIVLTVIGSTVIRALNGWSLIRTGFVGLLCFGIVTAFVSSAQVFRPAFIMGTFVIIVTVAGFRGACTTGLVRSGIVVAVGTGTAATALVLVNVSIWHLQHPPLVSVPVLPATAAILGTIGAVFGKRFGGTDVDTLNLVRISFDSATVQAVLSSGDNGHS